MIADPDKPSFARFSADGKVHVLRDARRQFMGGTIGWIMGRQWALCGAVGEPGLLYGVSQFDDRDLCIRCLRAWPGDQVRLFEHPQ